MSSTNPAAWPALWADGSSGFSQAFPGVRRQAREERGPRPGSLTTPVHLHQPLHTTQAKGLVTYSCLSLILLLL